MREASADETGGHARRRRRHPLDIGALDRRIDAAFTAAQIDPPKEIVLVGYSQGADRAEALVARFPDKYKAVVLTCARLRRIVTPRTSLR